MKFTCYGHPNLLATHRNTLEFTKDTELTLQGDCIVGVACNFDAASLQKLLREHELAGSITVGTETFNFSSQVNKEFTDTHELVFRRGTFASSRTLGLYCDKAAIDLPRTMVEKMKNPTQNIEVELLGKKTTQ